LEGDSYYAPALAIRWIDQSHSYFYLPDGLGSTRNLLRGDGDVSATYSYDAFGNTLSASGGGIIDHNPYRYVGALGYYADATSGLLHVGARYYNPKVGRFITRDVSLRDTAWHLNTTISRRELTNGYMYAENEPTILVDPRGKSPLVIIGGILVPVIGGGIVYDIVQGRLERAVVYQSLCKIAKQEAQEKCGRRGTFETVVAYPGSLFWPPFRRGTTARHRFTWIIRGNRLHVLWTDIHGEYHDEDCGKFEAISRGYE
jgi:RHS repeat-associated protein